jgi:hypothetical protein
MITNLDQLKKLIEWCKDNKIKKLKLQDIEFEISELDFLPEEGKALTLGNSNIREFNTETLTDTSKDQSIIDDEDLYWSSNT